MAKVFFVLGFSELNLYEEKDEIWQYGYNTAKTFDMIGRQIYCAAQANFRIK